MLMATDTQVVPRRRVSVIPHTASSKRERPDGMNTRRLLKWSELPEWQQDGHNFIETGYRTATPSVKQCVDSWWYLHNESVNIFSHLIGAILFFCLPFILYHELKDRYSAASTADIAVFAIYLLGVAVCFVLSVGFHTLLSHSPQGMALGIQLDFQGIIILMWSASAPMVYYTFITELGLQRIYWGLISGFAILASIVTFTKAFRVPAAKPLRAGVFGSLALSTLTVVIHGLVEHGWATQTHRFPMWGIGLTMLFNTIGASVYVLRFPEKWWPQKFDIFGASHQLMHISILIAGLAFLAGMIAAFDNARAPLDLSHA